MACRRARSGASAKWGAGRTAGLGWPALMHPARRVSQGPGASEWREARGGTREGRFLRCKARQHLRASIPHDVHLPLVTQLLHLSSVNNGRGAVPAGSIHMLACTRRALRARGGSQPPPTRSAPPKSAASRTSSNDIIAAVPGLPT